MLATARNGSKRNLPFVTALHGTDFTLVGLDRSYLPITRFSIDQSDGVTAIAKYLYDRTVKEVDMQRPIEAIHNFVNCDLYTRDNPHVENPALYANADEHMLIHLSTFRPVKRVRDVI